MTRLLHKFLASHAIACVKQKGADFSENRGETRYVRLYFNESHMTGVIYVRESEEILTIDEGNFESMVIGVADEFLF